MRHLEGEKVRWASGDEGARQATPAERGKKGGEEEERGGGGERGEEKTQTSTILC